MVSWRVIIQYRVNTNLHTKMSLVNSFLGCLVVPCTSCNSTGSLYSAFGDLTVWRALLSLVVGIPHTCHKRGKCVSRSYIMFNVLCKYKHKFHSVACLLVMCSSAVHIKCSLTSCQVTLYSRAYSKDMQFNNVFLYSWFYFWLWSENGLFEEQIYLLLPTENPWLTNCIFSLTYSLFHKKFCFLWYKHFYLLRRYHSGSTRLCSKLSCSLQNFHQQMTAWNIFKLKISI